MKISVTWGTGEGKTKKAAFDRALMDAGIDQYNLITLSSVIPIGTDIVVEKFVADRNEYGHRLYTVLSGFYAENKGDKAVAGLGWTLDEEKKGIFVEISGNDAKKVTDDIKKTFESMNSCREEDYSKIDMKLVEKECKGDVACAVVVAVYKSEGWE